MKIVFLDMDEVLCTAKAHTEQNGGDRRPHPNWPFRCALDRQSIALLNSVISEQKETTLFVSSSTWRQSLSRQQLEDHLRHFGWTGQFHDHWKTLETSWLNRGQQISGWLSLHPEVTGYAIIDDNPEAGLGFPTERFVYIQDPIIGFQTGDAQKLRDALR